MQILDQFLLLEKHFIFSSSKNLTYMDLYESLLTQLVSFLFQIQFPFVLHFFKNTIPCFFYLKQQFVKTHVCLGNSYLSYVALQVSHVTTLLLASYIELHKVFYGVLRAFAIIQPAILFLLPSKLHSYFEYPPEITGFTF